MNVHERNYFENDFCHGCLSFGRRCSMDSDNASLFYQLLDPFNIMKEPVNLILCWECEATLKKIRIFQYRVNKAQAHLQDVIAHKIEHKSLSTLKSTSKNIYDHTINSEIAETLPLPSSSLQDDESKLKSSEKLLLQEDIKLNNLNYEMQGRTEINQAEINVESKLRDKKLSIDKDEKYTIENPEYSLSKDLKLVIKKSELSEPPMVIKQELEYYYSDDNYIDDDHITLDVTAKEIKSEQLLNIRHKKKTQTRVQRERAKKTPIDHNKYEKYFTKVSLSCDDLKIQLNKWAKNKKFKSNKYKCIDCAIVFSNKDEEQSHKELHNNTSNHKCSLCSLNFNSESELVTHGAAHEFYQCDICLIVCRTLNAREGHLREYHKKGYWQCDECTLTFRLQTELTAHKEKLHRIFMCDYCSAKRYTKKTMQKHITANHMPIKKKCHLCDRSFTRGYHLKHHLVEAHNVPGLTTVSKESTYCVECNKQYNSMAKYKKHLKTSIVHTPKKKVLVPCPTCGKIFTKKTYLNNHYKLFHEGGTKHRCDPCNKCYSSAYGLRQHLLRYHKKVPMPKTKVCETCGLGFQTNRILIHHMRTHTGERPYECSYCPARFAQKYARDVHVRNVHLKHLQHFIA